MRQRYGGWLRYIIGLRIPIRGYEFGDMVCSIHACEVTNPYKGL